MSKKVTKSSNMNEKLRMILSNNLKAALDIEKIMSNLNLKAVSAIGCASVIASCSPAKSKNKVEKNNNELSIGGRALNFEQIKEFKTVLNAKELSPEVLGAYITKYAQQNKMDAKNLTIEYFFEGDKLKDNIKKDLSELNKEVENKEKKEKSIKNEEYGNLSKDIKEKLKHFAGDNGSLAKEFWDTIKSEEKIDELIKNDQDLKRKYENFKKEKENGELIKNQLTKAGFDEENQETIKKYISFLDDIKVNLNTNTTASNYLFNKLKKAKNQSEIVKVVANLYKQVISGDNINDNVKKQLRSMIKSRFDTLISESYKGQIEIKDKEKDITIEKEGTVKVKFYSKIPSPKSNDCTIEYNFFKVDYEELKYRELKDDQEEEKSLSLNKLMCNNDIYLSNYQFADKDTTALNTLVTPTNPMIAKIETAITKAINVINTTDKFSNDTTKVSARLNTLKEIIDDLLKGQITVNNKKIFIENLPNLDAIYTAMNDDKDKDKEKGKTAFEAFIKTKFDEKRKEIYDFFTSTTEANFTATVKITLSGYQLLGKKGKISGNKTLIEKINEELDKEIKNYAVSVKEFGDTAGSNSNSKLAFTANGDTTAIDGATLEIATAFETIKSETKQFLDLTDLSDIFGTSIKNKLIATLKTQLDTLKFADNGTKTKAQVIQEYMDSNFKDYNDLSRFNMTDLNDQMTDSTENLISDNVNGLTDTKVSSVVATMLKQVFGDIQLCKAFFDALNTLAKVDVKSNVANVANGTTALARNNWSLANIKADDDTLASSGNADAAQISTVVQTLKDAVLKVGKKYNDWVNCKDANKRPCDEIKNLLQLIVADYKNDTTFSLNSEAWVKLGNLLVKWMYVNSANWSGNKNTQKDDFNSSTKALASCFFNKVNAYKGAVTDGNQTINAQIIDWAIASKSLKTINIFYSGTNKKGIGGSNMYVEPISKNIIWHTSLPDNFNQECIILYKISTNDDQLHTGDEIVNQKLSENKANNVGAMYALLAIGGYDSSKTDNEFSVYEVESNIPGKGQRTINTPLDDPNA